MNSVKKFIWIFFSIFLLSQVFAIGVYNDYGKFTYYVNSPTPTVDINITAGSKKLFVEKGFLSIDGDEKTYPITNNNLNLFQTKSYSFDIDEDITLAKEVKFKLYVKDATSGDYIVPYGDPVNFNIEFDDINPKLVSVQNKINEENKLILNFNKKINYVKLTIDSKTITFNNVLDYQLKYDNSVIVDMSEFDFSSELYTIKFNFEDLAGNKGNSTQDVYVHGADLNITLLTLQDDDSLKYNYDADYVDFFNKTIYSKSDNYELKIKTNKPATCYFSSSLSTFKRFNEVMEKETFLTTDNLVHRISVDQYDTQIWVACKNVNSNTEIVYLSDVMGFGNNLISLKVYDEDAVKILASEPKNLVTNNPFSLYVTTNNRAICKYKLDSKNQIQMDSTNYTYSYIDELETSDGSHSLNFECFDVLNNKDTITSKINVDPSLGVRVVSFEPEYVGKSSATVTISLSDSDESIECRYNDEKSSVSNFANFFNVSGTGFSRTFLVSSLSQGNNSFYVYCKKDDQITESKIEIIYDTKGVKIENLTFVNGKYESDYVGSESEFGVSYDIISLIPIKTIIANVSGGNVSYEKNFSNDKGITLKGDFVGATNLRIKASNMIGVNSSKDIVVKFDLNPPTITFRNKGDLKEIVCNDLESGCSEIFYGFSQTSSDCKANKLYNNSVDVRDKYYMCVEAFDYANQRAFTVETIQEYVDNSDFDINDTVDNNDTTDYNSSINGNTDSEDVEPLPDSPTVEPNSSTGTIVVIGAIVLLLAGVSGGGYYAYRKGYLNNELEKLGIKMPAWDKGNEDDELIHKVSKEDVSKSTQTSKFTTKAVSSSSKGVSSKSSYEDHLDKLNKFIDSKVKNSDDLFDKFNDDSSDLSSSKSSNKDLKVKKISKDDYDEFYNKSSKSKSLDDSVESLEKEAENFEKYLKDKKDNK